MSREREMLVEFQWRQRYRETLRDLEEELQERRRRRRLRYSTTCAFSSALLTGPRKSSPAKCTSAVSRRPVARFEWRHRPQHESLRRSFALNDVQKHHRVDLGEEQSCGDSKAKSSGGATQAEYHDCLGEAIPAPEQESASQLPIEPHVDDGGPFRLQDAKRQQDCSNISSDSLVEVDIVSGTLEDALNDVEQNHGGSENQDGETIQSTATTASTQDAHKSLSPENRLHETWQMMHALQQKIEQVKAVLD